MPSAFDSLKGIKEGKRTAMQAMPVAGRPGAQAAFPAQTAQPRAGFAEARMPQMLPGRVMTGIQGFDLMTQGGFAERSINLLSGGPGSGKTIFGVEFLANGVAISGEPGLYLTFAEPPESIIRNMRPLGLNLERLVSEGRLYIMEYNPAQLLEMLNEGGGILDNLMNKARAKRVVIDSISVFLMIGQSEFGKKDMLSSLFKLLAKWEVTTLLIDERSHVLGTEKCCDVPALDFEADSITLLYNEQGEAKRGQERQRYIEVLKMRGTNHLRALRQYEISNTGFKVY